MSFNQVTATIVLGLIASLIFFFVQKGVLDFYFFRDEAKSAAEQAQMEAYRAEAIRRQEAAAKARAEAEAERQRRTAIEEENRIRRQRADEENRRARIQAEIDAQQARQRAAERARLDAQQAAIAIANQRRAYRAQNGGCDIGTHRVCVHIGPTGGGPGGYNAGCFCQSD
jgi:flagellar biosynthesis GTPase FlhF